MSKLKVNSIITNLIAKVHTSRIMLMKTGGINHLEISRYVLDYAIWTWTFYFSTLYQFLLFLVFDRPIPTHTIYYYFYKHVVKLIITAHQRQTRPI